MMNVIAAHPRDDMLFLLRLPRHRSAAGSTRLGPQIGRSGGHFFAGPYEPGRHASRTWSASRVGYGLASMGRLTLNILLSFAQFEREVIGERIRDKFAASRKKGMWMGGWAPLGYDIKDRKLLVNEVEAATVRGLFQRFLRVGSMTKLVGAPRSESMTTKGGKPVDKGYIYRILNNRVYLGEAVHKGIAYPGEHQRIIDQTFWDRVHEILRESPRTRAMHTRAQTPA